MQKNNSKNTDKEQILSCGKNSGNSNYAANGIHLITDKNLAASTIAATFTTNAIPPCPNDSEKTFLVTFSMGSTLDKLFQYG